MGEALGQSLLPDSTARDLPTNPESTTTKPKLKLLGQVAVVSLVQAEASAQAELSARQSQILAVYQAQQLPMSAQRLRMQLHSANALSETASLFQVQTAIDDLIELELLHELEPDIYALKTYSLEDYLELMDSVD